MKKIVLLALAVAILSIIMAQPAQAEVYKLFAGQSLDAGTVTVTEGVDGDGDPALIVEYEITLEEICGEVELLETHLHLGTDPDLDDFPLTKYGAKRGNPKIGNFDYSGEVEFVVKLTDIPGYEAGETQIIYIGAHAVIGNGFCEICAAADLEFTVTATIDCCGPDSFFTVEITAGDLPAGTYPGWCAISSTVCLLAIVETRIPTQ